MSSDSSGGGVSQEFTLSDDNTFAFLPGPMAGVSCPACFRDVLLKEVISTGECNSCGAGVEVTLSAETE